MYAINQAKAWRGEQNQTEMFGKEDLCEKFGQTC